MFRKFAVRLFGFIFIPLVACQLPNGQATQPMEQSSTIPLSTRQPTSTPVEEVPLQFETLELRGATTHDKYWTNPSPGVLVVATVDEIESVRQYVTDEASVELEKLDFSQYFALVAFQGWKSYGPQEFQIQEIISQDSQVSIFAHVRVSQPGESATGAVVSLYHLIKIPKPTTWSRTVTFKLYFDRSQPPVVTVEHNIP